MTKLKLLPAALISLLTSSLLRKAEGADLSRPAEGTRPPGEIISKWWATSSRNEGRLAPESANLGMTFSNKRRA